MEGKGMKSTTPDVGDGHGMGGPAGSDAPTTPQMPKAGRTFQGAKNDIQVTGPNGKG